jgi:hypothetical protein
MSVQVDRWRSASPQVTLPYNGSVVKQRAKTVVEWAERMSSAAPPTEDDVTVLLDGRRLDSRESVEAWLTEVDAIRLLEAATYDTAL